MRRGITAKRPGCSMRGRRSYRQDPFSRDAESAERSAGRIRAPLRRLRVAAKQPSRRSLFLPATLERIVLGEWGVLGSGVILLQEGVVLRERPTGADSGTAGADARTARAHTGTTWADARTTRTNA